MKKTFMFTWLGVVLFVLFLEVLDLDGDGRANMGAVVIGGGLLGVIGGVIGVGVRGFVIGFRKGLRG